MRTASPGTALANATEKLKRPGDVPGIQAQPAVYLLRSILSKGLFPSEYTFVIINAPTAFLFHRERQRNRVIQPGFRADDGQRVGA